MFSVLACIRHPQIKRSVRPWDTALDRNICYIVQTPSFQRRAYGPLPEIFVFMHLPH